MSLREQISRAQQMGSELRKEIYGEALEFSSPAGTRYEVTGVMSGVMERQENVEGGQLFENDGQVRVIKADAAAVGLVPAIGMLVRRMSGGKVYRVDGLTPHDGSLEYRMDINGI